LPAPGAPRRIPGRPSWGPPGDLLLLLPPRDGRASAIMATVVV
jgi:hypothetical protein